MNEIRDELFRCGNILRHFACQLLPVMAFAALSILVGIGLAVAGRHFGMGAISILGEALMIGGVGVAAWHAIAAEFRALALINREDRNDQPW